MAFAASDTHAAVRPDWEPLSCEYAYYHALRYDGGTPNDGATLPGMMTAIAQDGQPYEADWPYLRVLPSDLAQWKPPTTVGQLSTGKRTEEKGDRTVRPARWGFAGYRRHDILKGVL